MCKLSILYIHLIDKKLVFWTLKQLTLEYIFIQKLCNWLRQYQGIFYSIIVTFLSWVLAQKVRARVDEFSLTSDIVPNRLAQRSFKVQYKITNKNNSSKLLLDLYKKNCKYQVVKIMSDAGEFICCFKYQILMKVHWKQKYWTMDGLFNTHFLKYFPFPEMAVFPK